jgi:hypothetical protein
MSKGPWKRLPEPVEMAPVPFIVALSKPKPVDRFSFKFLGMTVARVFSRRPRVLRLEVSKSRPKGYGSPLNPEGA